MFTGGMPPPPVSSTKRLFQSLKFVTDVVVTPLDR